MRRIIPASIALVLILWPHLAHARELERGEAIFSVQNSLLRSDSDFFTDNQSENDFIINLRQDTIDFGRLEADIITSNIETRWKVGQFRLGVKEIWVTETANADFEVGDVNLDFRTLPWFFTNSILPSAPIRAFSTEVHGKRLTTKVFTGWFTYRDGYLGNAFTRQDEYFYGLNLGLKLPHDSFFGAGFIRTENERTDIGTIINSNNNIFLVDGRIGLVDNLAILGEFLYSYYDPAASDMKGGQMLVVGPSYKDPERMTIDANYRNISKDFYYLTRSYQPVNNQEGVYAYMDYRSPNLFYVYGSSDFYWMEPTPGVSTSLIYNWAGNVGFTYYPRRNWYVNLGTNLFKKYTDGPTLLSEGFRYDIFAGASGTLMQGKFNVYSRFRYREDRSERPNNIERNPRGTMGVRWYLDRRLNMLFEGEGEARWDDLSQRDLIIARLKYYVDWRPLSFIYVTPGIEYVSTFDNIGPNDRNQLTLSLNYGHEFRHGFSIFTSVRWTRGWGNFSDSYLDLFVNLQKVFRWGRPHLRVGIPRKDLPTVSGTVKGSLFIDENGDRTKQPWEKGIPNIPIVLDGGFVTRTGMNGEYRFENVLIGEREIAIDMYTLPLEYIPLDIKHKIKVHVRLTSEVDFPIKDAGANSIGLSDVSGRMGRVDRLRDGL